MTSLSEISHSTSVVTQSSSIVHEKGFAHISLETLKKMQADPFTNKSPPLKGINLFTILFTSDTHSNFDPLLPPPQFKPFTSTTPLGGIIRRVQYLEHVRKISQHPVLVLDAGDFLQGTPYFRQFGGEAEINFMNLARYDIVTLGNHDFDNGWPHLDTLLKKGTFNSICSNIYLHGKGEPYFQPYRLLEIAGQHIAIVGIMGENSWNSISQIDRNGLDFIDPMKALDHVLPQIRPYVDLIILLSHSGIKEDREFAKHPLVDIIIGGHSHTWMKEHEVVKSTVQDHEKVTAVFHSLCYGMLVGKMDVAFEKGKFSSISSSIQPLDEQFEPSHEMIPSVKAVSSLLKKYQKEMGKFEQLLGNCVGPLSSEDIRFKAIPLGYELANALREIGEAHAGVIYSGTIRSEIKVGPFTFGDLHRVYGVEHELWIVSIKGSQLRSLLQSGENRWSVGERTFQIAGITFSKNEMAITEISVGGVHLDNEAVYKIVGPSFFFEREFMNTDKQMKAEFVNEIEVLERRSPDLRIPLAEFIKAKGLGQWINKTEELNFQATLK